VIVIVIFALLFVYFPFVSVSTYLGPCPTHTCRPSDFEVSPSCYVLAMGPNWLVANTAFGAYYSNGQAGIGCSPLID